MVSTLLAVTALVAAVVVPATWRSAGTEVEASGEASSLLTLVNQARANNGLAPLLVRLRPVVGRRRTRLDHGALRLALAHP